MVGAVLLITVEEQGGCWDLKLMLGRPISSQVICTELKMQKTNNNNNKNIYVKDCKYYVLCIIMSRTTVFIFTTIPAGVWR